MTQNYVTALPANHTHVPPAHVVDRRVGGPIFEVYNTVILYSMFMHSDSGLYSDQKSVILYFKFE